MSLTMTFLQYLLRIIIRILYINSKIAKILHMIRQVTSMIISRNQSILKMKLFNIADKTKTIKMLNLPLTMYSVKSNRVIV